MCSDMSSGFAVGTSVSERGEVGKAAASRAPLPKHEQLRRKGNEAFATGKFARAVTQYSAALKELAPARDATLLSNRSAAYAKLARYEEALKDADIMNRTRVEYQSSPHLLPTTCAITEAATPVSTVVDAAEDSASSLMPTRQHGAAAAATGVPPFCLLCGGCPSKPAEALVSRLQRQRVLLQELDSLVCTPAEEKNVWLLQAAAEMVRLLGGGRATMCKSGKDRTSMSVTLEHGRLLRDSHGLSGSLLPGCVRTMRRSGVRRENVYLNTSRRLYAFNWIQQSMLPAAYRPPAGSAEGGRG